jgi:hypothetical protein
MWITFICVIPILLTVVLALLGICRLIYGWSNDGGCGRMSAAYRWMKAWTGTVMTLVAVVLFATTVTWLNSNNIDVGSYSDFKASFHAKPALVAPVQAEEAK